jgi:antitoxin VapB
MEEAMELNIEDEEAARLAKELAELTGKSVEEAVTDALRERLERVKRERAERFERIMEITRDCAALWKEPYKSIDHGELLYDDVLGLPRED